MKAAERLFCSLFLHSCCKELCTYTWVYTQTHIFLYVCLYRVWMSLEKQAGERLCADCGVTRKKEVSLADTHP